MKRIHGKNIITVFLKWKEIAGELFASLGV